MLKSTKMSRLDKYLLEVQQKASGTIVEGDNLRCDVCGRLVKVYVEGKGPLICCGKNMKIS